MPKRAYVREQEECFQGFCLVLPILIRTFTQNTCYQRTPIPYLYNKGTPRHEIQTPMPLHSLYPTAAQWRILLFAMLCLLSHPQTHAQILDKGNASYYSDALHGRKMSNGDRYHRDSLTCAHLKLPFGTMLKVRNLMNDKVVVVKVTDRGPFSKRFVLDLSKAAARQLGILGKGYVPVEISLYNPGKVPFLLEEPDIHIPEFDLQLRTLAEYPEPLWQQADSTE